MRWRTSSSRIADWHEWFAWRPVVIDDEWVWLEVVARRVRPSCKPMSLYFWDYGPRSLARGR